MTIHQGDRGTKYRVSHDVPAQQNVPVSDTILNISVSLQEFHVQNVSEKWIRSDLSSIFGIYEKYIKDAILPKSLFRLFSS
jgi:hypothetical protein